MLRAVRERVATRLDLSLHSEPFTSGAPFTGTAAGGSTVASTAAALFVELRRTVKRHWDGILRWFDSRIANGLIEGINSLVQAAKAKARGYRSMRNLKAMVYLLAGKLDLRLPA
ncbi:MAG: transposase [Pseudonocardiaceae bacterium]